MHRLGGHATRRVIRDPADRIGSEGIPNLTGDFVLRLATHEFPDSGKLVTYGGFFRLGRGK
jgi:hypothetical protein